MPKLTVGYSQTIGVTNADAHGASVAVEMDFTGPPANPDLMKAQIAGLFHLAREAVAAELAKTSQSFDAPSSSPGTTKVLLPMNRNGHETHGRTATPNQVKALFGLARRAGLDLKQLVTERFGVRRPDDLAMKQASVLIDELKRTADAEPAA